mmetsp:Transcript_210/g.306  ORF Transcript_210/g.306 Transcript_210/m.306 type:complete len:492 (+) Transcript_210:63-1538(+)
MFFTSLFMTKKKVRKLTLISICVLFFFVNVILVHVAICKDALGGENVLVNFGEKPYANRRISWLNPDPSTVETKGSGTYFLQADFKVNSKFEYPVLYLKAVGYAKGKKKTEAQYKEGLAKFVFLGNGTNQQSDALIRQGSNFHWMTGVWDIRYKFLVNLPSSWAHHDGLSFRLFWRLEYSSHADAIADYPVKKCSFHGNPKASMRINFVEKKIASETNNKEGEEGKDNPDNMKVSSWLRRSHEKSRWRYDRCHSELSWMGKRPYHVLVIGDSQPSYMCKHLQQFGRTSTDCVTIKGNWSNSQEKTLKGGNSLALVDFSLAYSNALNQAAETARNKNLTLVVLFNTQGLWEVAYGQLELFPHMLNKVLKTLPTNKLTDHSLAHKIMYFFVTTTAVHPHNYQPGIFKDSKKWAMTQPRVHAINELAISTLRRWYSTSSVRVDIIDLEEISLLQEEDPMVPGDMRHYGNRTNELLLAYLLCEVDESYYGRKLLT